MINAIREFLRMESASGLLLIIAMILAMVLANSPLHPYYNLLLDLPVEIRIGEFQIAKPLLLWINDGLMAVFFFHVGLELKREVLEGELSDIRKITLPGLGAIGGMLFPALIYMGLNFNNPVAFKGWAIPAATDIAFALGILLLLGKRVPISLKVFLVSLAIFDDIGAIIIIAIFYTADLSLLSLTVALICLVILFIMNRRQVMSRPAYIFIGLIMWTGLLKSGVHATLAGAALAMFIPMRDPNKPEYSPLRDLEHELQSTVAFGILPLFAFANAGLSLAGVGIDTILHPVPLGIAAGLFVGKQLGVFIFCWLGVKLGLAALPAGINWRILYGVGILAGIGFTMSLFIGSLAFEEATVFDERLGIIIGSLVSGVIGYLWLSKVLPKNS